MSNKKDEISVYFIESHNKGVKNEIYIKKNRYNFVTPLKTEIKYEEQRPKNIIIENIIYSFKIILSKLNNNNTIMKVKLLDEKKNKFEAKIDIQNIEKDKDYFIFNIKLESTKLLAFDKACQSSLRLPDIEIFHIYMRFIKDKLKEENIKDNPKIEDLMYYTYKILLEKKNYNYYFFADILIENLENKNNCVQLFRLYKKEKINYAYINESRMIQIKSEINNIYKNINLLFDHIKGEKDESNLKLNIELFLFYFNYYYQREEINRIAEIKNANFLVYEILISNKFENLSLTKNAINCLFNYAKNFEEIEHLFHYNNNFLDLIELVNDNKRYLLMFYVMDTNTNTKNKFIKISNFIIPKNNDNLTEIYNQIQEIISYEKKNNIYFLCFSDILFNKYIEINKDNYDNVIILYKIAKYIKENDKISGIKTDKLLEFVHNKGFLLIENNLLQNSEILLYLENDELYMNQQNQANFFKIVNNINIDKINSDFIEKWKAINWESMYHNKKNMFFKIFCNSLKDIKNFNNLFILYEEENKDKMNYEKEFIIDLLSSFERLFGTCNESVCENTAEVAIKLMYLCDIKSIDPSPVINCIKKDNILKAEIYNKLINAENTKYSETFILKIFNYFDDKSDNFNKYNPLLFIIQNSKQLKSETISFLISNYSLTKNDFFYLIENNTLKIYKELLNNKFLEKGELVESKYLDINNQIDNELRNGTIEFYYINNFYSENKENILFERLLMIARNDESIANEYKKIIEEHMTKINNIIKDDIIYKYLSTIFPESQKNNINKLKEIRDNIFDNNLIYYKTIEKDYLEIKNKFIREATENYKYINNRVFMDIYNYLKRNNKDENNILLESKEYINILKIIIEKNNLKKIKYDILKKYLKILIKTKKTLNELMEDISIIISDFDIKTKVVPQKLAQDLLLLSESEKYTTVIEAVIDFINMTKGIKTYFYSVLNNMYNNLNQSYDFTSIKLIIEILKGYKIDINTKSIELLVILKNKKDEKDFLFNIIDNKDLSLKKINDANKNNNNIFIGFDKVLLLIKNFTDSNSNKKWKDKEIISEFQKSISNNEEIYFSFKNYLDKFTVFKDNF